MTAAPLRETRGCRRTPHNDGDLLFRSGNLWDRLQ